LLLTAAAAGEYAPSVALGAVGVRQLAQAGGTLFKELGAKRAAQELGKTVATGAGIGAGVGVGKGNYFQRAERLRLAQLQRMPYSVQPLLGWGVGQGLRGITESRRCR
jgi:hypothetical protein